MASPEVVPLKAPLGARIEGLDRADAGRPEIASLLNRALGEHLLVIVPGERMTPEQMRGFASAFGRPKPQVLRYKRSGTVPEVSIMVSTLMADGTTDKTALRSEDWHTDDSYLATPAKATLLHSIELPSQGGTTWFCNMHSVYEALPEAVRRRIDGKRAIHSYDTSRARNRPSRRTAQEVAETPDVEHPLVRTHPETGRKALYLNFNRLDRIVGMEREESDALLDALAVEARKPEHHHGHAWSLGDIVVWDNRATMHRVDVDYPVGEARVMQRVLIEGDRPY
ncbi:TauD/TfdA family dioxygenase [Enhydrobacter sp.]|jgi:taurine dioxygenase|uniref:TauD/TfdA dioxygenase family protein n=1 Tax=Enhydrobacter sp. TaxID=1894999 RepID=UPI002635A3A0|nr:TauD/TfdA family dioxygenase [Enhydrobacter sp.]WIM14027.1 MAG: dioxygenase, TauD/TfdA family [Enhydrobacter sp.]